MLPSIWGNIEDNNAITDVNVESGASDWVQKDRDYYMSKKSGYTYYAYPHPWRDDVASAQVHQAAFWGML